MHWKLILICITCMFLYAALGGVAFHFIETNHERSLQPGTRQKVAAFLQSHPCVNLSDLTRLDQNLKRLQEGGLLINPRSGALVNATNWDIMSAIFVASQIIGAVGYGNITPHTVGGRVFTVLYTCVGIPLFIILAYGAGRPIARLVRWIERRYCGSLTLDKSDNLPPTINPRTGKPRKSKLRKIWVYFVRVLVLFIIGTVFFVLIPAAIFTSIETWSYGDSIYFCFVSVLSVGFGDFVPGDAADQSYRNWYRLATGCWIYLSVAFFVVVFLPIQEALNYRQKISEPFNPNEEDPFPFDNVMKSHNGDEVMMPPSVNPGWHAASSSVHSRPSSHSSGVVNNAFDPAPYHVYNPTGQSQGPNSYISVDGTSMSAGGGAVEGLVTSIPVNMQY